MIPSYLIFAHLISDFVLQPSKLVEYKEKSFGGVLIHSLIHVVVATILLFPYLGHTAVWNAILVSGVIHAVIDQGKISLQIRTDKYVYPFMLDQMLHFFTLYSVITFFKLNALSEALPSNFFFDNIYVNKNLLVFLIAVVFCTVVYDIVGFQLKREKNSHLKFHFHNKHATTRVLLAAIVFAAFTLISYAFA